MGRKNTLDRITKQHISGSFKKCEVQFFIEDSEFELSLVLNRSVGFQNSHFLKLPKRYKQLKQTQQYEK
jgi:hypothetical protein